MHHRNPFQMSSTTLTLSIYLMLIAGSCNALRPAMFARPEPHQPGAAAAAAAAAENIQPSTSNRRSLHQVPYGAIIGGVQSGVNAGIGVVAPVVSGLASNIPIMVPSFQGHCMNGQPIAPLTSRPDQIWCIVASGAQLTDGFFKAFAELTGVAGNVAGMFLNRGH